MRIFQNFHENMDEITLTAAYNGFNFLFLIHQTHNAFLRSNTRMKCRLPKSGNSRKITTVFMSYWVLILFWLLLFILQGETIRRETVHRKVAMPST